jgi:putative cardiolipin synthase
MRLISLFHWLTAVIFATFSISGYAAPELAFIDNQIAAHPQQSGVYVLDKGEEALLARLAG